MRRIVVVLALGAIVLVGCGDDGDDAPVVADDAGSATATTTDEGPPEPAVLDVTSVDFGYELSTADLPAGPVQVNQVNEGDEPHQVTLMRLDGMTPEELVETVATQGDGVLDPTAFAGGPNNLDPGGTNSALVTLEAGDYVAYCFLPDHAAQGMVEPLTVTGDGPEAVPEVEPSSTIGLDEFAFDVPEGWDGQGSVEVVNTGDQAHELTILTADQANAGGLTAIGPGDTGYVDLALPPGDYRFVCFVQDPDSTQIHLQLGMDAAVTVS